MVSKEEAREILKRIALEVNPKMEKGMEKYFAKREEVRPGKIQPVLEFVETQKQSKLFRSACSFWSVPVSSGYGRRIRILVFDKNNVLVMYMLGLFQLPLCRISLLVYSFSHLYTSCRSFE